MRRASKAIQLRESDLVALEFHLDYCDLFVTTLQLWPFSASTASRTGTIAIACQVAIVPVKLNRLAIRAGVFNGDALAFVFECDKRLHSRRVDLPALHTARHGVRPVWLRGRARLRWRRSQRQPQRLRCHTVWARISHILCRVVRTRFYSHGLTMRLSLAISNLYSRRLTRQLNALRVPLRKMNHERPGHLSRMHTTQHIRKRLHVL